MNSSTLKEAFVVWQQCQELPRSRRGSAVKRLAPLGFTVSDISHITEVSMFTVSKILNKPVPRLGLERWEPRSLDMLYLMALRYEAEGAVAKHAVLFLVQNGVPLRTLARLTGVPIDELREVISD